MYGILILLQLCFLFVFLIFFHFIQCPNQTQLREFPKKRVRKSDIWNLNVFSFHKCFKVPRGAFSELTLSICLSGHVVLT